MDFETELPPNERFFVVCPMTAVSREVITELVRESIAYAGSCGRTHVLVDLRGQQFEATLAEEFQFAMESFEKPLAFLESMLQRAGYDWRFFSNTATAKAWLRGKYRPADARFHL